MSDARVVEERLSQATRGARRSRGPRYQTRPRLLAAGVAWALAASLPLAGCSDDATGKPSRAAAPPAVPVTAADALEKTVPLQLTAVGNAMPYTSVAVKSQVAGQIVQMHFKEGQDVAKGELLVTIDPRPFEAALRQAEAALVQRQAEVLQAVANLERDTAQLANARVQERRYRELVERELVAREQYDQFRTSLATMESTVQADHAAVANAQASAHAAQANVDNAKLQLAYTAIRAPIDGRTGNVMVQVGNVVKGNDDNPIVVINQIHPMYVSFSVPEQHLDDIKKYRAAGSLRVEVRPPHQTQTLATGALTFINNAVDQTTATIQLKATFANTNNALWPGQFVDVMLTLTSRAAIVVPSQAIQPGQQGPFVFVVKADQTVESRLVVVGARLGAETIVEQGLRGGERVVTDGQLRLVPGARVEIKPVKPS
ncbi:MAG: efflux RND transporter periplasmic adaptor subunit [Candidatus Rokuibacteriota bacterium]|nr:MAG: efflux RND transporter periplasmic adaptor subunit [Candidatus Rokubacteria bacterium]